MARVVEVFFRIAVVFRVVLTLPGAEREIRGTGFDSS
jgi:hypothetical protein